MRTSAKFVAPQQMIREWIFVVLLAALSLANDEALNFAVQVDPVVFLQEPVSTVTVVGSSLQLSCQARVKPLISGFRLPSIEWRHNGSVISSTNNRIDISSNGSFGISTLSVHDARPDDAGHYECVANDGHLVIGSGGPRYRTISKRAVVEIINLKVVNVSVLTGEPLILDCGTALYSDVTLAWFHNETSVFLSPELSQRWYQLSNGSLLVYSAMEEDSGEWMCVRTDRQGKNTNTSNTVVHVTQDTYSGNSLVIIDAPISPTPESSSFVVYCLTAPDPMAHVVWKRSQGSGLVFVANNSRDLKFENFNSSQSDRYTCELLNSTASNSVQLTLTAIPNITNQLPVQDMIISRNDDSILLTCSTDGVPAPTVHWFKDGQPISQHLYNSTTGILSASKAELNNRLYGVYQCFAENSVGRQYATIRTLLQRFANPPGMVSCSVKGVQFGPVEFTLSWTPPVLTGKGNIRYVVKYFSEDEFGDIKEGILQDDIEGNTTTFELTNPGATVDIFIHLLRPVIGPQAVCVIAPALRFLNNQPIPLTLNFEQGNVTAQWFYSRIAGTPSARNVQVNGSCVHGIDVFKYSDFLSDFGNMHEALVFTDLPNGTVCHFNGSYRVDISPSYSLHEEERQSFSVFPIPLSSGHVAQPTPNNEENGFALGLACDNSTVQLLWTSSRKIRAELESLNITGLCIDASGYEQQHNLWIESDAIASTSGSSSLLLSSTGMQSSTLCGFTATGIMKLNSSLQALPVQCIVNEYSPNFTVIVDHDDVISSVTSSIIETSFVSAVTSSSPYSSAPSYNSDTVVAVSTSVTFIVLVVMFTAVLITMVLLCARRKYSHASQYFEAVIFKDSLDNQITITIGDNVSVKTDVQPLDNEECFDEQPNGNNMWLFSEPRLHDSGCIMEPPQLVCSKLDHSGSSGYGSSYTPDSIVSSSTNYHKTIDQDLPNEQHIIREEAQSPVRSFSFCQSDPVDQTNPQTIIPYPSSNDHTMLRTTPEESSLPLTCSQCHSEVTVSKWHQGNSSIASIGDDQLSQSSDESSDYCLNCLKCDHCGHDNCVYIDEKGYIRFKIVTN